MAIKVCSNGHITGTRTCPMCSSEVSQPIAGAGRVLMSKYELHKQRRRAANGKKP